MDQNKRQKFTEFKNQTRLRRETIYKDFAGEHEQYKRKKGKIFR